MKIDHRPDGATIADTMVIATLFARPAAAVRRFVPRHAQGYDVAEAERLLADAPDLILITAADAGRYLNIPAGTVRAWACRGLIRSYDHTPDGLRPMYDVGDLLRLRQREDER